MKLSKRYWLAWLAFLECCHLATGVDSYPPEVIQQVETSLLSLFGYKKRPPRVSIIIITITWNCQFFCVSDGP